MTSKRLRLLHFIANYREKNGIPPTFAEMVEGASLSSNKTIILMLRALKKKGLVYYKEGAKRTVSITSQGYQIINKKTTREITTEPIQLFQPLIQGITAYGSGITNESSQPVIDSKYNIDFSSTTL